MERGESMTMLGNETVAGSSDRKSLEMFGLRISRSKREPRAFDTVRPYLPSGDPGIVDLPKRLLKLIGFKISRVSADVEHLHLVEASDIDLHIINVVRPYTMTSVERVWALVNAIQYISRNQIE